MKNFLSASFVCKCGNATHLQGFFPCDKEGGKIAADRKWDRDYKCALCGAIYSDKVKRIIIHFSAITRMEYSEIVDVPFDTDPATLAQLVQKRYEQVDGGEFSDDPDYWERGVCRWERINEGDAEMFDPSNCQLVSSDLEVEAVAPGREQTQPIAANKVLI